MSPSTFAVEKAADISINSTIATSPLSSALSILITKECIASSVDTDSVYAKEFLQGSFLKCLSLICQNSTLSNPLLKKGDRHIGLRLPGSV